jgi:hypothetical protein
MRLGNSGIDGWYLVSYWEAMPVALYYCIYIRCKIYSSEMEMTDDIHTKKRENVIGGW